MSSTNNRFMYRPGGKSNPNLFYRIVNQAVLAAVASHSRSGTRHLTETATFCGRLATASINCESAIPRPVVEWNRFGVEWTENCLIYNLIDCSVINEASQGASYV